MGRKLGSGGGFPPPPSTPLSCAHVFCDLPRVPPIMARLSGAQNGCCSGQSSQDPPAPSTVFSFPSQPLPVSLDPPPFSLHSSSPSSICLQLFSYFTFLLARMVKLRCNAGDQGSIPGSGRSPGEGNGNSLQQSCLENPMDRGA